MNTTTSSYQHIVLLVVLSTWSYRALLFHPYEWNEYCEHWDDRANFLMSPHVTSTLSFPSFYTMCTTSSINVWEPYGNLLKNIIFAIGGTAWTQRITSWLFHTSSSILLYFVSQNMLRLFLSTDHTTSTPRRRHRPFLHGHFNLLFRGHRDLVVQPTSRRSHWLGVGSTLHPCRVFEPVFTACLRIEFSTS